MHLRLIMIYIFRFHEILFSNYLDMAPDGQADGQKDIRDGWKDGHGQNNQTLRFLTDGCLQNQHCSISLGCMFTKLNIL